MTATVLPAEAQPQRIHETLRKYWGFESLRPTQDEVIQAALIHRDAVVVMPTGGGKSLCFQLPPLIENTTTVVISPLIALMKDQVDALQIRGVAAAALNSSMSEQEEESAREMLVSGNLRILYVSPERLLLPSTLAMLKQVKVARFAIDEAHCISEWGHDFRPEYRQLHRIKAEFPDASVMAFTATATPRVQKDIAIQLKLTKPRLFVGTFDRPNLTYRIVAKDDPVKRIVEAVQRYPDEGIIVYCLSRANTETITAALNFQEIPAVAYHAGLDNSTRKKISEDYAQERANVVVATVAFGMGIDRANVRCVIHDCLPKSMEGYQQETGRAGRDGLPSECVLLYNHGDIMRLKRLFDGGNPDYIEQQLRMLEEVRKYATSTDCRHKSLSEYFGQNYDPGPDGCGACDVCLGGMRKMEDSTAIGHQILRAVQDLLKGSPTGFGVAFVVGVLVGSRADQIKSRGGVNSPHWGAFKDQHKNRVTSWVHQLMDQGLLATEGGQFPVVLLPPLGEQVLREEREITIRENEALLAPVKERRTRSEITVENMDEVLFETFRQWRRKVAEEKGVPPYVIFHDVTLMRIAAARPSTPKGLFAIPGMGEMQMNNYGGDIMKMVASHCAQTGVAMDQELVSKRSERPPKPATPGTLAYLEAFKSGESIENISKRMGVTPNTVCTHLADWVASGEISSIDLWVQPELQSRVQKAFVSVDSTFLRPVFDALSGEVDYGTIRIVKAWTERQEKDGQ